MKKKNLNLLSLNKKAISNLGSDELKGGTLPTFAQGCTIAFSDNCSSGDPRKMCQPCH